MIDAEGDDEDEYGDEEEDYGEEDDGEAPAGTGRRRKKKATSRKLWKQAVSS